MVIERPLFFIKRFLFFSQWLGPTKHLYPVYKGMILGICSCINKEQYLVFFQPTLAIEYNAGFWYFRINLLYEIRSFGCLFTLCFPHQANIQHRAKPLNSDEKKTKHYVSCVETEADNKFSSNSCSYALCPGLSEKVGGWWGEMREGSADIKTTCREVEPWLNLSAPDRPLDVMRLTQFWPCVPSTVQRKHCSPALHPVINHRRRFICRLSGRAKQIKKRKEKKNHPAADPPGAKRTLQIAASSSAPATLRLYIEPVHAEKIYI